MGGGEAGVGKSLKNDGCSKNGSVKGEDRWGGRITDVAIYT